MSRLWLVVLVCGALGAAEMGCSEPCSCPEASACVEDDGGGDADGDVDGDVDADLDGGADGGETGPDAGGLWPLPDSEVAFRVTDLRLTAERRCDLDGDGTMDNAFADLGNPMGENAAVLFSQLLEPALESPAGMGVLFPIPPPSAPPDRAPIILAGDRAISGDRLVAPAESLDGCGEPLFTFRWIERHGGAFRATGGELPLPLGQGLVAGEARLDGATSFGAAGPELTVEACVALTIAELASGRARAELGDESLLQLLLNGGASFGRPAIVGLSADLDLDGDGLERVNVDSGGSITGCVDGDSTVITGPDCWADSRMADGFGLTVHLSATQVELAGRGSGWLGCCEAGPPAESAFGESRAVEVGSEALLGGANRNCYLAIDGSIRCWGENPNGELGYGHAQAVGDDETPASQGIVDVGGPVVSMAFATYHTCASFRDGSVRCWGTADRPVLGIPVTEAIGDDEAPSTAPLVDVGGAVRLVGAGSTHTCALLEAGSVRCWGVSASGQLGYGNVETVGDDETPASAGDVSLGLAAVGLEVAPIHTCATLTGGGLRCWGQSTSGQLGYGNTETIGDDEVPSSMGLVHVGGSVVQVSASLFHTCAILEGGAVRCWGSSSRGQLGYGNTETIGNDETPASAGDVDVGGVAVQLVTGGYHTCALLDDGAVRCWGAGDEGQLGYGNTEDIGDDEAPATAGDVPLGGRAIALVGGGWHNCALLEGGIVRCWGRAAQGQLGYGNTDVIGDDETPDSVGPVDLGICRL